MGQMLPPDPSMMPPPEGMPMPPAGMPPPGPMPTGAPPPGGIPPELAAMLGGGGAPPEAPPEAPADSMTLVQSALDMLQQAIQAEPDNADSGDLAKAIQLCYKILGNRDKEKDAAMGGGPASKFLSRASGG